MCSLPATDRGRAMQLLYNILAVLLLVSVAYLVDSTYNPFIYFRF